ncbi:MAG TPA: DUF1850 domain-containing protein, partial [Bacillus sp. (in: firmicutes)]|nr:DUF1850 domain-containing protein [Bacillus sp. (in: firmicutes)]
MIKRNHLHKYLLALFILVLISVFLFIPNKDALVFQYQNSGKVLAYFPLSEGDSFQMKYIHSIHLSDVVESYTVTKGNEIKQIELMYEDFAIGMPENASDGETFEQIDGKYFLKNMDKRFPSFDLRIGKVRANHTLVVGKNE